MRFFVAISLFLLLTGCSSLDMERYENNRPALDLFAYFTGGTKGWGIVRDRKGALLRQFVVDITGTINEKGYLVMDEHFNWSDGEISTRIWTLEQRNPHHITGTAGDVIGKAEGVVYGNVLNWRYQVNLEVGKRTWKINFDDWMYKVSDTLLLNKATMSKFGFNVGEVLIVFQKNRETAVPDLQHGEALLQIRELENRNYEKIP